jgi:hypothetical protein
MRSRHNYWPFFAVISVFPVWLNTVAVVPPLLFFAIAIGHYAQLGMTTDSHNSLRDSKDKSKDYLILNILAIAEIGGFAVLLIGFFIRLMGNGASAVSHNQNFYPC